MDEKPSLTVNVLPKTQVSVLAEPGSNTVKFYYLVNFSIQLIEKLVNWSALYCTEVTEAQGAYSVIYLAADSSFFYPFNWVID